MATYKVKSQGVEYTVSVVDKATGGSTVTIDGRTFDVELADGDTKAVLSALATAAASGSSAKTSAAFSASATSVGDGEIVAPIPGTIISIQVKVGDSVSAGQTVLKLEAMKMENDISSPVSGIVKEIAVSEGSDASTGQLLMTIG